MPGEIFSELSFTVGLAERKPDEPTVTDETAYDKSEAVTFRDKDTNILPIVIIAVSVLTAALFAVILIIVKRKRHIQK